MTKVSTGASNSGRSLVLGTSHLSGLHSLTGPGRGTCLAVSHARACKYQYMTPGFISKSLDRDRLDTRRWPPSTPSILVSYGRITFFPRARFLWGFFCLWLWLCFLQTSVFPVFLVPVTHVLVYIFVHPQFPSFLHTRHGSKLPRLMAPRH